MNLLDERPAECVIVFEDAEYSRMREIFSRAECRDRRAPKRSVYSGLERWYERATSTGRPIQLPGG